jgi:hypothetical protein
MSEVELSERKIKVRKEHFQKCAVYRGMLQCAKVYKTRNLELYTQLE